MNETIQFDLVADLYDDYVNVDFDIGFFLNEAKKAGGKVLELTSGTGRVSIPLLKADIDLTCVDYSPEMLAVLQEKMKTNGLKCQLHNMDMTELSLPEKYNLIMIPFNSLSEITDTRKHQPTLERIYSHLTPTGKFICTLHNPKIRLKTIDGTLRMMGKYPIKNERTLIVQYVFNYNGTTQIVSGIQFYEIYDKNKHQIGKRYLDVNFYLFGKDEFEKLITAAGFKIADLYGDYSYSKFDADTSPFMIWRLKKSN
jgi:ubiquinone/menaquinone biosynthesis C-methylase UbiE